MPLDFSKISSPSSASTVIDPRDLFSVLPAKHSKYAYLRDVQAQVLDKWFERRTAKDLRLKMNTGGGKTVVGLLILQSCLNQGKAPAVYVAPTPYLAEQVVEEARSLGIAVEDDPRSTAVNRGKAILVTSIYTLLNGISKFGVGTPAIYIGSLVLDDSHACLSTAESQFTLTLPATHNAYAKIFTLFRSDLEQQSSSALLDVEAHEPHRLMLVPFWAWQQKVPEVEAALHESRDDNEIKFNWPLIRNHLQQCRCVVGAGQIEISPRCLPVEMVPSFVQASHRVFMSATFSDDSVLVTHFDANPKEIETAIAPRNANDIGDRMILVPQELDPSVSDDDIKAALAARAKTINVVVIVPSHYRAKYWDDVADLTLTADNLRDGVDALKKGHVGLTVLVNKYDGIDLPNDACRILVLDGLPHARRGIDAIELGQLLYGTRLGTGQLVQQIEQGMGRGVRASDDYCAVLLMGRSLTGVLFSNNGIERFTPATRAQFDLSEQIGEQVRQKGITEIDKTMDYCLDRNPEWSKAAKSALLDSQHELGSSDLRVAIARRKAFDQYALNDKGGAIETLQELVDSEVDVRVKGWLMSELASYTNSVDTVKSQQILQSALRLNRGLAHPLTGIEVSRLAAKAEGQADASLSFLRRTYGDANSLIVGVNSVLDRLSFRPNSYKDFHRAMSETASILGFASQFPEELFGRGPDVLWAIGGLQYFVIECKNEATVSTVSKKDCNQLAGSMNWFTEQYDDSCGATPVLVHPSAVFEYAATPPPGARIVTTDKLESLREAVRDYCLGVSSIMKSATTQQAATLLAQNQLTAGTILQSHASSPSS